MSRYTGSEYRKSRRLGFSILETGKELIKRPFAPGQHGQKRGKKLSNFGIQLQEKQKVRFMYGLNERQFHKTFIEAGKLRGVHGEDFLKLLESRIDNLVYRMGLASTRAAARQLVNHGHITVNGKKVDIPSFIASKGDVISFKEGSAKLDVVTEALAGGRAVPTFLDVNKDNRTAKLLHFPERNEIANDFNESLVVEFYNR